MSSAKNEKKFPKTTVRLIENKPTKTQYGYGLRDPQKIKFYSLCAALVSVVGASSYFGIVGETPDRPVDKPFNIKELVTATKNYVTGKENPPVAIDEEVDGKPKKVKKKVKFFSGPQKLKRPLVDTIPPGSIVHGKLITGASNGPVKVLITKGLEVGGLEVIPEGASLLGEGQSGEERLFIRFSHLMFEDGIFMKISAAAADKSDQVAGLKGSKIGGHMRRMAAATALNFAAGYSEGLKEKQVENGQVVDRPTAKNALLNGASSAALELSTQEFQKLKNKRPVIFVEQGEEILIIFAKN